MKLIYPALAQIFWTLVVLVIMFRARQEAFKAGTRIKEIAVSSDAWPDKAKLAQNNFANQFETPVLFYALVMFAIQAGATGWVMQSLAWVYVATRIAHTLIHTGANNVKRRALIFSIGLIALLAMLIGVVIAIN
ncbi:MAG: MAPEG family protein [Bosea sp. (in: a-proteobacteria)]